MSSCTFHAKRSMFWLLPSVPPLDIPGTGYTVLANLINTSLCLLPFLSFTSHGCPFCVVCNACPLQLMQARMAREAQLHNVKQLCYNMRSRTPPPDLDTTTLAHLPPPFPPISNAPCEGATLDYQACQPTDFKRSFIHTWGSMHWSSVTCHDT